MESLPLLKNVGYLKIATTATTLSPPPGSSAQSCDPTTELTWSTTISGENSKPPPLLLRRNIASNFWPLHYPLHSKLILVVSYLMILIFSITIFIGPLILSFQHEGKWCPLLDEQQQTGLGSNNSRMFSQVRNYGVVEIISDKKMYDNPVYDSNPCRYLRLFPALLGLTLEECDMCRRMMVAVLLGGAIGYERSSADRPAGIRTMGLVALGSCVFTIGGMLAFVSSPMKWDASLVTTSLPSGIGFLGGALIWKGTFRDDSNGQERHQVHGLTTAASLWLSAAVGVGAGGALYVVTTYSTILVLLVLRYGPRYYEHPLQQRVAGDQTSKSAAPTIPELMLQGYISTADVVSERGLQHKRRPSTSSVAPTFHF